MVGLNAEAIYNYALVTSLVRLQGAVVLPSWQEGVASDPQ